MKSFSTNELVQKKIGLSALMIVLFLISQSCSKSAKFESTLASDLKPKESVANQNQASTQTNNSNSSNTNILTTNAGSTSVSLTNGVSNTSTNSGSTTNTITNVTTTQTGQSTAGGSSNTNTAQTNQGGTSNNTTNTAQTNQGGTSNNTTNTAQTNQGGTSNNTTNTNSTGCQPDPVMTTNYLLANSIKSFTLMLSLCRDGSPKFGFFVGQRVFAKLVIDPSSLPAKICISTHNHLNNCNEAGNYQTLAAAGYTEESPGVYRAELTISPEMSGYGYIANVSGRDFSATRSIGFIFPEGIPTTANSASDIAVSTSAAGAQTSSLKVGDSAFIRLPAASVSTLKVCFEDMAVESSCRRLSDYAAAGSEFSSAGGVITFRIPVIADYAGHSFVVQIYDSANRVLHSTSSVIRVVP